MSQVAHPYGYRLVTVRPWRSNWFAGKTSDYREFLRVDTLLRQYLEKRLRTSYVADVLIERDRNSLKIILHTSRPGLVIGKSGEGITKLRKDVAKFFIKNKMDVPKDVKIDIADILSPESNAKIVGLQIVEQLEKRMPFKRVMKMMAEKVMQVRGVEGVRFSLSGRLGGADMSRTEDIKLGSVPLQFIRADIDYATERANMTYGVIGVKVWINKGDTLLHKNEAEKNSRAQGSSAPRRS